MRAKCIIDSVVLTELKEMIRGTSIEKITVSNVLSLGMRDWCVSHGFNVLVDTINEEDSVFGTWVKEVV